MNLILLAVAIGLGFALLLVIGLFLFELRRRKKRSEPSANAPGKLSLAAVGLNAEPEMSLNTVVMRPTLGLRIFSLGFGAAVMLMTWGPFSGQGGLDPVSALMITVVVFYATVMIANYEARYDDEGLTAPDYFFRDRTYDWTDYQGISADGQFVYRMRFGNEKPVFMQKYLVGMPTFLRFLKDVEAMNQRA